MSKVRRWTGFPWAFLWASGTGEPTAGRLLWSFTTLPEGTATPSQARAEESSRPAGRTYRDGGM